MSNDRHRNFVNGSWLDAASGDTFPDENPADRGSVIGRFSASSAEDVRAAIDSADRAFLHWRETSLAERQSLTGRFLTLLRDSRETLAAIMTRENGKTIREARAEVDSALTEGTGNWHQSSHIFGHTLPNGTAGMSGWFQYSSLGVVGLITPWNFPANTICRKALPALLTGNTVILKPASYTPWSGVFLADLFRQAGFPAGVVNCVTGGGSIVGNALASDPRVRAISFTGSTEVGRAIQEKTARSFARTQLELGGKNALVVLPDADLEAAVTASVGAGFACSGQWCTATSRILVHESVYRNFVDSLAARSDAMVLGDPMEDRTDMGPVAGEQQFNSISSAITQAQKEGARMVSGGVPTEKALRRGYFIRPTIFGDVSSTMRLFREEVFGPVIALSPFNSLDDAILSANDSSYGLSASIFTSDIDSAFKFINRIEVGVVHVNVHTGFKDPALPFGGWKDSGFGPSENDTSGFEFFLNRKAVYIST